MIQEAIVILVAVLAGFLMSEFSHRSKVQDVGHEKRVKKKLTGQGAYLITPSLPTKNRDELKQQKTIINNILQNAKKRNKPT